MFNIKIADIVIGIYNKYEFVKNQCADYLSNDEKVDFTVCATEQDIANEKKATGLDCSNGYFESTCIYRHICYRLPSYNAMLIHSSVVKVDGFAYAFTAKSGTGKSTHTQLWKSLLGDKMTYINGDKPVIRIVDGTVYAYGTPWCGKEGFNTNDFAQLGAICFLERSGDNCVEPIDKKTAGSRIMHQIVIPEKPLEAAKSLELLDAILKSTSTWLLKCNTDISAAKLCYNIIKKGETDED